MNVLILVLVFALVAFVAVALKNNSLIFLQKAGFRKIPMIELSDESEISRILMRKIQAYKNAEVEIIFCEIYGSTFGGQVPGFVSFSDSSAFVPEGMLLSEDHSRIYESLFDDRMKSVKGNLSGLYSCNGGCSDKDLCFFSSFRDMFPTVSLEFLDGGAILLADKGIAGGLERAKDSLLDARCFVQNAFQLAGNQ